MCALLTISLDEEHRAYSMTDTYEALKEHLPQRVFPFAVSSNGDYFCFDYRQSGLSPRIVFWFTEASGEDAFLSVAVDFFDLLMKLHD